MILEQLIDIFLLAFLAVISIAILRIRDLFSGVMLFGIYSLVSASLFMVLDAADVAFTEAAVGAGIATILMLATLGLTGRQEKELVKKKISWLPLIIVVITGATLVYGIVDLPPFGAADNPAQVHVTPRYVHESMSEIDVPNLVTAVLASYRGFDTLGEVVVIFTAGVGVLLLIGRRRRKEEEQPNE
jgi:multicomponent Na+:H+ antiporter subunit B